MATTLQIFKKAGIWMFNDESKGIFEEPFVGGTSEIIDYILKERKIWNGSHRGIQMLFSDHRESDDMVQFEKIEDLPDNWAKYEYKGIEGLLCPIALHYLGKHPESIFARFTKPPFNVEFQIVENKNHPLLDNL
jgi:hypothetical protein